DQTSGLRFTRAALYQLSYASLVILLAETRVVGRSYGSRGALMLRERRPVRIQSFRAEYPLELGVRARNDLARDVGGPDDCVAADGRAPLRAQLFRRRGNATGAVDRLV